MKTFTLIAIALLFAGCSEEKDRDHFRPDPNTVYFEVGEISPVHGDSYLLPLRDEAAILEARNIIESGESKIIIASIGRITDSGSQVNIDLRNNRRWSWHVVEFTSFADVSIEILDGWPGYVEENLDEWIRITKGDDGRGRIGFWNYTVVREVSHEELAE